MLSAHNDYEAVRAGRRGMATVPGPLDWLQTLSHTQRAYRKGTERYLLWAILMHGKPLSSMSHEDYVAYRDFLAAPPADWCAPRSRERWSPVWRPFEGPLTARAQAYAVGVLNNLYRFLVDQNYLMGNRWHGVHVARESKPKLDVGRSLTEAHWDFVRGRLTALPPISRNRRLRFALSLLYTTGLRLSEIVAATTDHLEWVSLPRPGTDSRVEG